MNHRALFCLMVTACAIVALSGVTQAAVIAHYTFDSDFTDSSPSGNNFPPRTGTPTITTTTGE